MIRLDRKTTFVYNVGIECQHHSTIPMSFTENFHRILTSGRPSFANAESKSESPSAENFARYTRPNAHSFGQRRQSNTTSITSKQIFSPSRSQSSHNASTSQPFASRSRCLTIDCFCALRAIGAPNKSAGLVESAVNIMARKQATNIMFEAANKHHDSAGTNVPQFWYCGGKSTLNTWPTTIVSTAAWKSVQSSRHSKIDSGRCVMKRTGCDPVLAAH